MNCLQTCFDCDNDSDSVERTVLLYAGCVQDLKGCDAEQSIKAGIKQILQYIMNTCSRQMASITSLLDCCSLSILFWYTGVRAVCVVELQ